MYPSGLLLGDITPAPAPNTICIESNGTCVEGYHVNAPCSDGTLYYDQTCAAYYEGILFNRLNSSCVLANGTCFDGVRQNITCDEVGATFYYDQTCTQYIPLNSTVETNTTTVETNMTTNSTTPVASLSQLSNTLITVVAGVGGVVIILFLIRVFMAPIQMPVNDQLDFDGLPRYARV